MSHVWQEIRTAAWGSAFDDFVAADEVLFSEQVADHVAVLLRAQCGVGESVVSGSVDGYAAVHICAGIGVVIAEN